MYNNYILNTQFNAGIYIRLSQEDRDNDKNMNRKVKVLLTKEKC